MAIKVKRVESLLWPVTAEVPREDGSGKTEKQKFKVRYTYLPVTQREEMLKKIAEGDAGQIRDHVLGFEGIEDEDGPLGLEALDMLMDIPYYAMAINEGFINCQVGAAAKN